MDSSGRTMGLPSRVSPFGDLRFITPACGWPELIAACHVLHRLLLPRHPPCALSSLTIKFTQRGSWLLVPPKPKPGLKGAPKFQTGDFTALAGPFIALSSCGAAHQRTVKALIKNYSALYLPNRFSCQISSSRAWARRLQISEI